MIGHELQTPLASRSRLRPLFRRLFYREEPFVVLEPAQLRALYDSFACGVRLHPVVLYWIHRIAEDEHLVSSFLHRSMLPYSGLEIVHVTPGDIGYYRLPGAKVGGRGRVTPGEYAISIQAPGRVRHDLRIRKCRHEQLHLDEIGPRVESQATFLSLERHPLDRSKFADEMRMIVERAIEWDYQRVLLGQPDPLDAADRAELTRKCAGISPRVDAHLEHLQRKDRTRERQDV